MERTHQLSFAQWVLLAFSVSVLRETFHPVRHTDKLYTNSCSDKLRFLMEYFQKQFFTNVKNQRIKRFYKKSTNFNLQQHSV